MKSTKTSEIYMEEWLAALQETDIIPPGWHTVKQLRELFGFGNTHIHRKLNSLIKRGLVEVRKYRIKHSSGRMMLTCHYHLKKCNDATRESESIPASPMQNRGPYASRTKANDKAGNRQTRRN